MLSAGGCDWSWHDIGARVERAIMKTAEFFAERTATADIEASRRILRRRGGQKPEPDDVVE